MGIKLRYRNTFIGVSDEPHHHPDPDELNRISKSGFRCFACLGRFPKRRFGGIRTEKSLCSFCYTTSDDLEIAGYLAFDLAHGNG